MNATAKLHQWLCLAFFFFFMASCTTEERESPEPQLNVISETLPNQQPTLIDNITEMVYPHDFDEWQEPFDWENLEYLPLPSDHPPVPMPWSDQANRHFSEDIRYDVKKSDGWVLYLNSFSPRYREGVLTFSLYNIYRGVFRYYFYIESGTQQVQDFTMLQHYVYTTTETPLLNFTSQQIIDVSHNRTFSHSYDPQPLADATWYAVEYEIAFDKDIYHRSAALQVGSDFSMKKAHTLMVNGTPLDELNAKLRIYGMDQSWDQAISADASYTLYGVSDANRIANTLSGSDIIDLYEIMNLQAYEKVLDGMMYQPTSIQVKWNTKIDFHPHSGGVALLNDQHYISGTDLSDIQGKVPFYTKALGVFYLNQKPVYLATELSDDIHPYEYRLDISSVAYLFNPAVLAIAEVKNLQQELVATEQESLIRENKAADVYTGQLLKSNKPLFIQGVRVSFDIFPNNGGEKIHMVKTFSAEAQTTH